MRFFSLVGFSAANLHPTAPKLPAAIFVILDPFEKGARRQPQSFGAGYFKGRCFAKICGHQRRPSWSWVAPAAAGCPAIGNAGGLSPEIVEGPWRARGSQGRCRATVFRGSRGPPPTRRPGLLQVFSQFETADRRKLYLDHRPQPRRRCSASTWPDIFNSLQVLSRPKSYVNDSSTCSGRTFRVQAEADSAFRLRPRRDPC